MTLFSHNKIDKNAYFYRLRLAGIFYISLFLVLFITLFYEFNIIIDRGEMIEHVTYMLLAFGISILIFLERRIGIYLGFFFAFYLLWDIINTAIQIRFIRLPQILSSIFLLLSFILLIPIVFRDTKYHPPDDVSEDPQTLILEFFFFFMILGVIGFSLILLQK